MLDALTLLSIDVGLAPEEGGQKKKELREGGSLLITSPNRNVATAAQFNEFGIGVPMRPAWRTTARSAAVKALAARFGRRLSHARRPKADRVPLAVVALAGEFGQSVAQELAATIRDWTTPPNAERTVRDKGFNDPLVATEQTVDSLSAQVKMRGRRKRKVFSDGREG